MLKLWEDEAKRAREQFPLKIPKSMPSMIPISEKTKKNLKWKSLKWMVKEDNGAIRGHFLRAPLKYGYKFLRSFLKKQAHERRDDDFFLYGVESVEAFKKLLKKPNTLLALGFSYCHKPYECPSKRFSTECAHDTSNPVCKQCFIGKCKTIAPQKNIEIYSITTVHYIGEQIFKLVHENPNKEIIFIITACEMTLRMFGDYGNMVGVKGIGAKLGGRICNTMQAFELSERGTKPGLTIVETETQSRILDLLFERSTKGQKRRRCSPTSFVGR